ncbi:MAG: hypothetical protein U5J64_11290 [Halobacteriales archaeon]|nr:hypothetical protein [Halobacteriales archaeon]
MPESGRTAKQVLGLVSLVLVPFGVFTYIYSSQILKDESRLPQEALDMLAAPVSLLDLINALSVSTAAVGMVFLLLYVLDYVKNPDVYAENYSRRAAIIGIFGGLVWIVGTLFIGYLPAATEVSELLLQQDSITSDNVQSYAVQYERAVFRLAMSGGALVLGFVWWLISLVSWVESPDSTARIMTLDNEPYCNSCGAKLTDHDVDVCYDCGKKLE